jgi:imidazolonepropionase-like amidohydrolase
MDAIVSATAHAAEAIGLARELGTLEPGKLADAIVVDGDVLRDISAIRKIELVVSRGRAIAPGEIKFD